MLRGDFYRSGSPALIRSKSWMICAVASSCPQGTQVDGAVVRLQIHIDIRRVEQGSIIDIIFDVIAVTDCSQNASGKAHALFRK